MKTQPFGCVNNTIRLRSERYFDLANPRPDQFTLADIAGALSKICRFGGHCPRFYSVAEHLVHCSNRAAIDGLPLDTQIAAFAHDFTEAFVGDMVKPLKIMLTEYEAIEANVEAAIAEKYLIDFRREESDVKRIDREMLIAERNAMFSDDGYVWTGESEVRKIVLEVECWAPNEAEARFMHRAKMLGLDPT